MATFRGYFLLVIIASRHYIKTNTYENLVLQLTEFNTLNYSPSCERNKAAISDQLGALFPKPKKLLEIGSLSGQHAVYIAKQHPQLQWQSSDLAQNIPALTANLQLANVHNIAQPIALDVANKHMWPSKQHDIIYTANTLHIMSWQQVQRLFENMTLSLADQATLCIYGPFKYQGNYTSESNADFQLWLKDRDPQSGIRDFEAVNTLAESIGFTLEKDIIMPANNQLIVWRK